MPHFHPREMLRQAQSAEEQGMLSEAANTYALLSVYFRKKNKIKEAAKMIMNALRLVPQSGRLYLEEAACLWALKEEAAAKESISKAVSFGLKQKKFSSYVRAMKKTFGEEIDLQECFFSSWLDLDRTQPEPFDAFAGFLLEKGCDAEAKKLIVQGLTLDSQHIGLREKVKIWVQTFGSDTEKEIVERFLSDQIDLEKLQVLLGAELPILSVNNLAEPLKKSRSDGKSDSSADDLKDLGQLVEELEKRLNFDLRGPFEDIEPLINEFRRLSNDAIGADFKTRIDLAYAFFEMGRLKEAKNELERVEPEQELFGQARYLLGLISLKEGRDLAALGIFQEVSRLAEPEGVLWKESLYQLLKLYLKFNDTANATIVLQKLNQVDSNYRELKALRNALLRSGS